MAVRACPRRFQPSAKVGASSTAMVKSSTAPGDKLVLKETIWLLTLAQTSCTCWPDLPSVYVVTRGLSTASQRSRHVVADHRPRSESEATSSTSTNQAAGFRGGAY